MNVHSTYALASRSDVNQLLRTRTALSRTIFCGLVLVADAAIITAMAWASGAAYHVLVYETVGVSANYFQVGTIAAAIFAIAGIQRGDYSLHKLLAFKPQLRHAIQLWNGTFICLLILGFLTQSTAVYSRGWLILYYFSTTAALLGLRSLSVHTARRLSRSGVLSSQRIFLFGAGRDVHDFLDSLSPKAPGVTIVGCHFLTPLDPAASAQAREAALAHDLERAIFSARVLEPDAVFLAMPLSATEAIRRCAQSLLKLPAEIHLASAPILRGFQHVQLSKIGSLASLQLTRPPLSRLELAQKRVVDLLLASFALLLLTPLLLIAALLIKIDSRGPVFFLQQRYGFNQKPFRILKFRTMRTLEDGPQITQATQYDVRVTRVGRWLRRWNIDELPQLFNVITGEMSLVGPRPHALSHNQEYERRIASYARRHNVKPGITGWAQIHGLRGETDTDEKMAKRVEHDLYYIDNWSLSLDLKIILLTVVSRASYRNAY
jgi:Undecaprenyl-phosphate glucose phosphotransferase